VRNFVFLLILAKIAVSLASSHCEQSEEVLGEVLRLPHKKRYEAILNAAREISIKNKSGY
jgi:hypothetical protein